MAKVVTKDQLQDCMERTGECISDAAGTAAGAVREMGEVLSDPMTGATADVAGASGMVPEPAAGDQHKFLRGDGTWADLSETLFVVSTSPQTGNIIWIKPTD